jgi:hypothetical protein
VSKEKWIGWLLQMQGKVGSKGQQGARIATKEMDKLGQERDHKQARGNFLFQNYAKYYLKLCMLFPKKYKCIEAECGEG